MLLGNGPTLSTWNLADVGARYPMFGINRSWKAVQTEWTCHINHTHHLELANGTNTRPSRVVFTLDSTLERVRRHRARIPKPPPAEVPSEVVAIHDCSCVAENGTIERKFLFRGQRLDRGTLGHFAGYLAIEIAAWIGWSPIYLVAYDGGGGHFDEPGRLIPERSAGLWQSICSHARPQLEKLGVSVINCNPASKLTAFEFGALP